MEIEKNLPYKHIFDEAYETYGEQPDEVLGRSSLQPCENKNSSSRKTMAANHKKQAKCLKNPEFPLLSTGNENLYGQKSSAFIEAESDLRIIGKISRFSMYPDHEYYLIVIDSNNKISMIERKAYVHTTETFGYLWNNDYLDNIEEGNVIPNGTVYKKSRSFDDFNNYRAGTNVMSCYMATANTTQDPVIISKECQKKLSTPVFKEVEIKINDNDVFLNLYGNNDVYKAFPDLGEDVKDGILCSIRKANTDTMPFELSVENIQNIMISDETIITGKAKVIDIKIFSNKQICPDKEEGELYNVFEGQLKSYIDDEMRFCRQFVDMMKNYINNSDYEIDYQLRKMNAICRKKLNGCQFIEDGKVSSNMKIIFTVYIEHTIDVGDKVSNRFGGKGVISEIRPVELMPKLPDGTPIDIIWDESTCFSRLNLGQLSELSINRISRGILDYLDMNVLSTDQMIDELIRYYRLLSDPLADYMKQAFESCTTDDEVNSLLNSFLSPSDENGRRGIYIQVRPISESISIDTIGNIYKEFPYIKQEKLLIPIQNSDGTYRMVESDKPSTVGEQYIYVLKQEAEEKHSATSTSSTNNKDENSKSKDAKECRAAITQTPIRMGEMETKILGHIPVETLVYYTMIVSTSPVGRRGVEEMLSGDPYNVDIKLNPNAKNRSAEKVYASFKTMGIRLKFIKRPIKYINPFKRIQFHQPFKRIQHINPFKKIEYRQPFHKIEYRQPFKRIGEHSQKGD